MSLLLLLKKNKIYIEFTIVLQFTSQTWSSHTQAMASCLRLYRKVEWRISFFLFLLCFFFPLLFLGAAVSWSYYDNELLGLRLIIQKLSIFRKRILDDVSTWQPSLKVREILYIVIYFMIYFSIQFFLID